MAKLCFLEPFCLMRLGVRQGCSTAELNSLAWLEVRGSKLVPSGHEGFSSLCEGS